MKYPGQELENFDKATVWRKYVYFEIKKFIIGNTLEVGAGIGSFTNNYKHLVKNLTLSELDEENFQYIKKKFESENIKITNSLTENINQSFDTIMYLNVLEHIKDDIEEINQAYKKLNKNDIIVAYEPIWSIGTGVIPLNNILEHDISKIIKFLKSKFKNQKPKIIYGGSVNPENIVKLKHIKNINGFLVGGASLYENKFVDIIKKTTI